MNGMRRGTVRTLFNLLLPATFALSAGLLEAQPAPPVLELVSVTPAVSLDNLIFNEATSSITVTVGHSGGPTRYFVTASRGGSSTFEPRRMRQTFFFGLLSTFLDYNVFTPNNAIAKDLTVPISQQEVLRGNFGNTGSGYATSTNTFTVRIPADQFVRRGTYNDEIVVSLYQGQANQPAQAVLIGQQSVSLTSVTPTVAQIALDGQGQTTLDFGFLTAGTVREAELFFRTNAAYRIDATSEHGGVLQNVFQSGGNPVPYQLRVDGSLVDLTSPALITLGLTVAGSSTTWETIPLSVTIGPVSGVLPGLFQDVITFTISNF